MANGIAGRELGWGGQGSWPHRGRGSSANVPRDASFSLSSAGTLCSTLARSMLHHHCAKWAMALVCLKKCEALCSHCSDDRTRQVPSTFEGAMRAKGCSTAKESIPQHGHEDQKRRTFVRIEKQRSPVCKANWHRRGDRLWHLGMGQC